MTFWTLTFRTASILTVALTFVAAFASPAAAAPETGPSASDANLVLWYAAPARDWEKEALPIGNGRLGGMVFGGTGWSKAWKINFWDRLLDGDHAHKMLSQTLAGNTAPNFFDSSPS
jgi:hypothetical protein